MNFDIMLTFEIVGAEAMIPITNNMPRAIEIAHELCSQNRMPGVWISISDGPWTQLDLSAFVGMHH